MEQQLQQLRRHMLPWRFSSTGSYHQPDRVSVRALAYRVLCAAEIEHYLEDRCAEIAKTALDSWKTRAATSNSLVSLAMFSGIKLESPPPYLNPRPKDQRDWDDLVSPAQRIERCIDKYVDFATKENHGIREKNLLALLLPVGVDLRNVDPALITRMDAFGAMRGDAAHLSTLRAIRVGVDPADELKEVTAIRDGLVDVDAKLDELLAAAK